MSAAPLVRDATPADAQVLAELANALADAVDDGPGEMTAAGVRADWFGSPGLGALVAGHGGALSGYALWTVSYESARQARGLYVADLFVAPKARRRGLARALLGAVAEKAAARGGRYFWLVSHPGASANAFYDALGATADARLARAVFGPPFDHLLKGADAVRRHSF